MNPQEIQELAGLLQQLPGIKSIELRDVKKLAQLLRESPEIGSIEVKGWFGSGVVITRTNSVGHAATVPVTTPGAAAVEVAGVPVAEVPVAGEVGVPSHLKEIKSPMVGTFYKAPEPGAEAYVKVGGRVTAGETVCIVEAMKIMNEIEAELSGVVKEILAEDGQPVEYGQVLFLVDPRG